MRAALVVICALSFSGVLFSPHRARAQSEQELPEANEPGRVVYALELGASLFNENTGFVRARAANLGVGYRFGMWSVGIYSGVNYWRAPILGTEEQEHIGVLNVGPYTEWRFARERARAQIGFGWSMVVEPSAVDANAGSMGFFIDARPIGLRLPLAGRWTVALDPLSSALRVPDTTGVPLVEVQFMTWLRVEVQP